MVPAFLRQRDSPVPASTLPATQTPEAAGRTASASSSPLTPPAATASGGLCFASWNIRLLRNKYVAVADTMLSNDLDLLVITEFWLCVVRRRPATPSSTARG